MKGIHLSQLLQNMTSDHIKVKKVTGHAFYMATPSNATESVPIKVIRISDSKGSITQTPLVTQSDSY